MINYGLHVCVFCVIRGCNDASRRFIDGYQISLVLKHGNISPAESSVASLLMIDHES